MSETARPVGRPSFREQQFVVRESAIIDATCTLLARKGYDLMTMDEVAAEVGLAKASLYKHFESKESLAAAAMIRLIDQTTAALEVLPQTLTPIEKLRAVLRWAMEQRMRGGLPLLPASNTTLRESLLRNMTYIGRVMQINQRMKALITEAKKSGTLSEDLPDDVILYTIYARSCDPTIDYLRMFGQLNDQQIIEHTIAICFTGIAPARQ
jgi:TetR/AcrR family transcriptional regulator, regulator of autoinduction and epiphytic fitness